MMTRAQVAAFVNGQIALFNAEIEMMKAVNEIHRRIDDYLPYGEKQFNAVIKQYEGCIGHNAVLELFRFHQADE